MREEWSGVGEYIQGHTRRLGQARHELNFAQNRLNCETILLVSSSRKEVPSLLEKVVIFMTKRALKEKQMHSWQLKPNLLFDFFFHVFLAFWENNKDIEAKDENQCGIKQHFARRASTESWTLCQIKTTWLVRMAQQMKHVKKNCSNQKGPLDSFILFFLTYDNDTKVERRYDV